MTDRSEVRRELFWKQLKRADGDVQAWPDYVKQALIKPTNTESHVSGLRSKTVGKARL